MEAFRIERIAAKRIALVIVAAGMLLGVTHGAEAGYSDAVLDDNPVSYWRLNESSGAGTAADEQNANPGTYRTGVQPGNDGPRPTDGFPGFSASNRAPLFAPGNNDDGYIETALGAAQLNFDYPFTLEGWINTTNGSNANNTLVMSDVDANGPMHGFRTNGGEVGGFARRKGHDFEEVLTPSTYNDGAWHYVAAVFEPDTADEDQNGNTNLKVSLYVDPSGGTPAAVGFMSKGFANGHDETNIGALVRQGDGTQGDGRYKGLADEVAVYNAALSGTQIQSHFEAATVIPEPGSLALLAPAGLLMLRRRR